MAILAPFIGIFGVGFILAMAEVARAINLFKNTEVARKFVHILTATFIATWPFFMQNSTILWLSGLLFIGILFSSYATIFESVHSVDRPTYGELLYPVAIFLCAALASTEWIFAAAMLHLGLADGFAAVVGIQKAAKIRYRVYGQVKSLLGSAVFYLVSLIVTAMIVLWADAGSYNNLALLVILWLPLTATLVENFAVFGTDNLLVPLLVIAALNTVQLAA